MVINLLNLSSTKNLQVMTQWQKLCQPIGPYTKHTLNSRSFENIQNVFLCNEKFGNIGQQLRWK